MTELKPWERLDDLNRNGLRVVQSERAFRLCTDSVLLADFAKPGPRDSIVDLGAGNGAMSILISDAAPSARVSAVELNHEAAELLRRNVELNSLSQRIRPVECDMREAHAFIGVGHDLCVCNPPYFKRGCAVANNSQSISAARHEREIDVFEICLCAKRLLRTGGRLSVVFPAQRAFEMMKAMDDNTLSPKRIRIVQGTAAHPPKLVLIDSVKGGGSQLHWLPPLILSESDGAPTAEYKKIYRI